MSRLLMIMIFDDSLLSSLLSSFSPMFVSQVPSSSSFYSYSSSSTVI